MKTHLTLIALFFSPVLLFSQSLKIEVPIYDITLNKGFDIADVYMQDGVPYMYCYDTQTGLFGVWNMSDSENPITQGNISSGWDMLKMHCSKSSTTLLKARKGKNEVETILSGCTFANPLKQTNIYEKNYSGSWSFMNTFSFNKEQFLFLYSNSSGSQNIKQLSTIAPDSIRNVRSINYEKGIDFFDIVSTSTHHYLLLRSSAKKRISILKYNLDGSKSEVSWIPDHDRLVNRKMNYELATKWSHTKLFRYNNAVYVFLYEKSSGAIKVFAVDESLTSLSCIFNTIWSSDWTNFNFVYIDDIPYLFHQKESNGLARLSRIVL
ncbi:MAG: hypothetical protein ACLFNU_07825 [Bacteroidales bacterium]